VKGRRQDWSGAAMLLVSGLAVAVMVGLAAWTELGTGPRDAVTDCPCSGARGHTLVVIDVTDSLTLGQRGHLHELLWRVEAELPRDELLSVWALGSSPEGPLQRVFSRCTRGRQAGWWSANPRIAALRDDSLMARPLARSLESLSGDRRARHSGIAAALAEASRMTEFKNCPGTHRLLLVSDLLENTSAWSAYRGDDRRKSLSAALKQTPARPDLRGVAVDVVVIGRAGRPEEEALFLRELWNSYLTMAGASSVTFTRL